MILRMNIRRKNNEIHLLHLQKKKKISLKEFQEPQHCIVLISTKLLSVAHPLEIFNNVLRFCTTKCV